MKALYTPDTPDTAEGKFQLAWKATLPAKQD
jgi:hypothetical protein